MIATRRYALRRLNPYLGVTQVVDTPHGRGVSVDGVNWELQLRASLPAGWGVLNRGRSESAFFRFGVWSRAEGVARFPPARNIDPNVAEKDAAALLAEIVTALPALPFSLADTVECWLLDIERKPFALVASQLPDAALPERAARRWTPTLPMHEQARNDEFSRLAVWVAKRALPMSCWIVRDAEGNGRGLADPRAEYAAADFPETLVDLPDAADATLAELGARFLACYAPRLLMLPLADATRSRLEVLAARQPVEMERFFRLYPAVCDTALLNTARVQAQLIATA